MSVQHPIVALTGSSGAGTTTAGKAMQRIFARLKVKPATVAGDSFHRFTRRQMAALAAERKYGENNHFSLAANHMDRLRSEEHTSELQSREKLVCRLLLEKKKRIIKK